MIEVYHGGGRGHSASLLIALEEKRLAHQDSLVDLATCAQHDRAFLAVNPAGQLPVLRDAGKTLTETFFILLYLDERYPHPPLGGVDPHARYAVQKWGKYVETHIAPNLAIMAWAQQPLALDADARERLTHLPPERRSLWNQALAGFSQADIAAAEAALVKAAGRIADDAAGGPWLAGARWSIADIMIFPHAARFAGLGIAVPAAMADWLERVAVRPSVQHVLGGQGAGVAVATMAPERGRWG